MQHKHPAHTEDHRVLSGFFLGLLAGILVGIFLGSKKGKQLLRIIAEESEEKLLKLEEFLERHEAQQATIKKDVAEELPSRESIEAEPKEVVVITEELQVIEPVRHERKAESMHGIPDAAGVSAPKHVEGASAKEEPVIKKEPEHPNHTDSNGVHKKPSSVRRFFKGVKKS